MKILFWILAALLALFALFMFLLMPRRRRASAERFVRTHYAHRGLWGKGIAENSLSAFAHAVEEGYGIELDVQFSADGEVVVFHDESLFRVTGCEGSLYEKELSFLKTLRLSGTEDTIPTLREVLALVDGRVPLLVELKGENFDTSLCPKVAELLKDYKGTYCIESFNPLLIGNMKKQFPSVFCGLLYTNVCRDKKKCNALNIAITSMALNVVARPDFIAYNKEDREALPVRITTGLYGAPKFVWTVKTREELDVAHQNGEQPIFENIF